MASFERIEVLIPSSHSIFLLAGADRSIFRPHSLDVAFTFHVYFTASEASPSFEGVSKLRRGFAFSFYPWTPFSRSLPHKFGSFGTFCRQTKRGSDRYFPASCSKAEAIPDRRPTSCLSFSIVYPRPRFDLVTDNASRTGIH